jgi:hypothetical protein
VRGQARVELHHDGEFSALHIGRHAEGLYLDVCASEDGREAITGIILLAPHEAHELARKITEVLDSTPKEIES